MQREILDALQGLQRSMQRLEAKVQAIDERTQGSRQSADIPEPVPLGSPGELDRVSREPSGEHYAEAGPQASDLSTSIRELQSPRQRMLQTYKQIFFDVVPDTKISNVGQPIGEGDCVFHRDRRRSTMKLPKSMSLRSLLAVPAAVDSYYADEKQMWRHLKASAFYENMHFCVANGTALPFTDWIRMLMQVPVSLRIRELARIFDEEDTVTALSTLVQPSFEGTFAVLHLALFSIMHPTSAVRTSWDTFVLLLLFSVCIITPFMICFEVTYSVVSIVGIWEVVMDAAFILDVLLNFRTAFIGTDFLVTDPSAIAVNYLKGFFTIDILSTIPWDIVLMNETLGLVQLFKATKVIKLVRITRVLKLVRILRLLKAPTVIRHLELRMGRVAVRIASLVFVVVFILHLFACLFHAVALWNDSAYNWVNVSGIVSRDSQVDRYVTSMYWAMSTMATVGYGDVTPIQISEKIVAMVGMLVGVTIFAYIMSTVSSLLSTFNAQNIRAQETQRQLDSFCRAHRLPTVLARKLSTYYDYILPRTVHSEDLALVAGLSGALRQQVLLTLHAELFDKLPFFRDQPAEFLQHLLPELKLEYYAASEYVLWQGDMSTEMYFITHGLLEVRINVDSPHELPHESEELDDHTSSNPHSSARYSGTVAKHVGDMWKQHDRNPNLHQRPTETDTAPHSESGMTNSRRLYVRPLQQISKPLNMLALAVRQAVQAGATTMLSSTLPTRIHAHPHSTTRSMFQDDERSAESTARSEQSAIELELGAPSDMEKLESEMPTDSFKAGRTKSAAAAATGGSIEQSASHAAVNAEQPASHAAVNAEQTAVKADQPTAHAAVNAEQTAVSADQPASHAALNAEQTAVKADQPTSHAAVNAEQTAVSADQPASHAALNAEQPASHAAVNAEQTAVKADQPTSHAAVNAEQTAVNAEQPASHAADNQGQGLRQVEGVMYQESQNAVSKGTQAWVQQHKRRNSKGGTHRLKKTVSDHQPKDPTALDGQPTNASSPNSRSYAAKELVNRMIGIQGSPYRRVGRLGPGQYFGERACWTAERRTASVVTITSAEVYCLKRSTLKQAAKLWPDLENQLLQPTLNVSTEGYGDAALRNAGQNGYRQSFTYATNTEMDDSASQIRSERQDSFHQQKPQSNKVTWLKVVSKQRSARESAKALWDAREKSICRNKALDKTEAMKGKDSDYDS